MQIEIPETRDGRRALGTLSTPHSTFRLRHLYKAGEAWIDDRCGAHAAALSFYALFATTPLVILLLAVAEMVVGRDAMSGALFAQLTSVMGSEAARAIEQAVVAARQSGGGGGYAALSMVLTVIGATAVFAELKSALDTIFSTKMLNGGSQEMPISQKLFAMVKVRLASLGLIVGIAFLLVITLVFDTLVSVMSETWISAHLQSNISRWAAHALPAITIAALFALLLRVLLIHRITAQVLLVASVVGGVLFVIGKLLFALYVNRVATESAFGAAASLVVVLLWLYFSCAVFLYAAELAHAMTVDETALANHSNRE